MKKKALTIGVVALLMVLAITGVTLAYFTDNEQTTNTFTLGNVDITLTESAWVEPDTVLPAIPYAKNPVVTNVGENSAWIKVEVTLSDATAFLAAAQAHGIADLTTMFTMAEGFDDKWVFAGMTPPADSDTITYAYYYKELLAQNEDTGALFTAVTLPKQFNNADMDAIGDDFTITVTAHAMQDADFATVEEAFAEYSFEAKGMN